MCKKVSNREILRLAIPNVISNITIPLLGIVDLTIVGHLNSEVYIGAIAIGTMIFNLIYWAFAFLRMGTSGLTAQAYGAQRDKDIVHHLLRALVISVVVSVTIIIFRSGIADVVFLLLDGSSEVEHFANSYFNIRVWAAPATIAMYALTGWFIGLQNTKIPMVITIFVNVINIIFNYLFVYLWGFNSDGVAWGTVIAQYSGLVLAVFIVYTKYRWYFHHFDLNAVLHLGDIRNFFKVNRDIFIRTVSLLAVFTFFTSKSASENDNVLASNTLLLQFLFIFSFFTDGLAYAAEALSGKYYGAKEFGNLRELVKRIFVGGGVIAVVFTLLYLFFNRQLLYMLTNVQEVVDIARQYTFWVVMIPIVSVASFLWDGVFIGMTATSQMRNSMLISVFIVFFPIWYFLNNSMGNHALWIAFVLFFLARSVTQTLMYRKMKQA